MALPRTSPSVIHALQNLSKQTNKYEREALLNAGLKEILKWFSLAAQNIIENRIKLPKQTITYMNKHKDDVAKLANPNIDEQIKRKIILKPGGGGFLGGVIIRSLLRWDGEKTARKFGRDRKSLMKKTSVKKSPKRKTSVKRTPKKKTSAKSPKRKLSKRIEKRKTPKKSKKTSPIKINEKFVTMRRPSKIPSQILHNVTPNVSPIALQQSPQTPIQISPPSFLSSSMSPNSSARFSTPISSSSSSYDNDDFIEPQRMPKSRKQLVKTKNNPSRSKKQLAYQPISSLSPIKHQPSPLKRKSNYQTGIAPFSPLTTLDMNTVSYPARIALTALREKFSR